jgi:Rrf2 family protein
MKFSSRGHYGLQAMVGLARAYGSGPAALTDIAAVDSLPLGYLEQIMIKPRRAGLVEATRGAHGGYRLAAAPSQMTVGEVMRVLEGPIAPMECASEDANPGCCDRETECTTKKVWVQLRDSIAEVLDSTTLADLCREPSQIGRD